MNNLPIHKMMYYEDMDVKFNMKYHITNLITFHFMTGGIHIDGFNLFTLSDNGIFLESGIGFFEDDPDSNLEECLDLDDEYYNRLKIIGVDLL